MIVRWNVFSGIPEMIKKLLFLARKSKIKGVGEIYNFLIYDHDQWSQSLLNSRWYHRSAIVSLDRWWFYSCLPFVALAPTKWQISTLLRSNKGNHTSPIRLPCWLLCWKSWFSDYYCSWISGANIFFFLLSRGIILLPIISCCILAFSGVRKSCHRPNISSFVSCYTFFFY